MPEQTDQGQILEALRRMEKKVDALDEAVRGDGNGVPGLGTRMSQMETKMSLLQWLGGAIGGAALASFIGTVWTILTKLGGRGS